jgi:biopolymer transport protein ExbD
MSISICCSHCQAELSVHNRLAGKETKCPRCGSAFTVPFESPVLEDRDEYPVDVLDSEEVVGDDVVDVVEVAGEPVTAGLVASQSATRRTVSESLTDDTEDDSDEIEEIDFPKKELPSDDMDMTPMVDVTFLLLIFFMITASFSSEKAFEEPPPLPTDAVSLTPKTNSDSIRVQIDEFNSYTIIFSGGDEREASSKQELLIALDEAKNEIATGSKDKDDELKLLIEAHVDCIHGAVIAAVDAARDRGFNGFQVQVVEEFQ